MKLSHSPGSVAFQKGNAQYVFFPTGDIYQFTAGGLLLNDFIGSLKEGSANNLWLRVEKDGQLMVHPMLGIHSGSRVSRSADQMRLEGTFEGVNYVVTFSPFDELWFWDVRLSGHGQKVDVIYGQDVGLGDKGGVLTNELYIAQYLGHTVFETENGYCICSRQNQTQSTGFPYLQQGMICGRAVGYSTDGMQFFGLSYKADHQPKALLGDLENRNLQFECSYAALQTEKVVLDGETRFTFYALFRENHPDAIRELEFRETVAQKFANLTDGETADKLPAVRVKAVFGEPYTSPQWDEEMVNRYFPQRQLEERGENGLLSFFTEDHAHVVLQQKELVCQRPHGHISATPASLTGVSSELITTTSYIYGLFHGQTVAGNTSMHKFLSTPRGLLNILKNPGQRLWVKLDGQYRLLTLPSLFEVGVGYARWFYQLPDDVLVVTAFTASDSMEVQLNVRSEADKVYEFIVTNQLVLGSDEFCQDIEVEEKDGVLRFRPDADEWKGNPYPGLHYDLQLPGVSYTWSDDAIFFEDGVSQNHTLLTLTLEPVSAFSLHIRGALEEDDICRCAGRSFDQDKAGYQKYFKELTSGFALEGSLQEVQKLNQTVWWYAHNAMIHFSVPHGLEQPGGAAWGTRDVCQGPMELFLTTQHYQLAHAVLLNIFSHQSAVTGEWPQWFMFDRYTMNAGECHGDVIFWPLKCVGDYLAACGDYSILDEVIPYSYGDKPAASLMDHLKNAVLVMEKRFLPGTYLISYAGGDWDDTLQPASEELKQRLVSSWTQALAYQTVRVLGNALSAVDCAFSDKLLDLGKKIGESFHQYLIQDGVIAGFVFSDEDGSFRPMLHPADEKTGIHYRLLPMTRSIISDLVDLPQAEENVCLIHEKLGCPDGIRLMDRPAPYDGGVSHLFRRAEQAANVGREISLQYVHAHIRYIEAMCHLGRTEDAWKALFQINPILIQQAVPNALPRQSNLYFSSSEGAFLDRYQYEREFDRLRDGSIEVNGGWRLYSSGPGIYLRQLLSGILGLRFFTDRMEIDPHLPVEADGLRLTYRCFGKPRTFVYHVAANGEGKVSLMCGGRQLSVVAVENPYRNGGVSLAKEVLESCDEEIHIYIA